MFIAISVLVLFLFNYGAAVVDKDAGPVTCGSTIKLQHKDTGNYLHSHGIAWGSGSGQQSVTTNTVKNDKASLWIVKEGHDAELCLAGTPVKCGDVIRLEHADTKKNLHSHLFKAPLSGNQEVSGFADERGIGDTGDNWKVICDSKASTGYWQRYVPVSFMHVDTGKYLVTSGSHKFTQQNCGGNCPIMSQTEVSSSPRKDNKARWQTDQGIYFPLDESKYADKDEL